VPSSRGRHQMSAAITAIVVSAFTQKGAAAAVASGTGPLILGTLRRHPRFAYACGCRFGSARGPTPPYMKRFRGLGSRRLGRAGDWEPTTVTALF
jgi:hypothetical protein